MSRGRWDERYWFRRISRYHVDFVICEPRTTEPLLVVELDDRRHRERRARTATISKMPSSVPQAFRFIASTPRLPTIRSNWRRISNG